MPNQINLDEMDKLKHKPLKQTQEEIKNLNRPITSRDWVSDLNTCHKENPRPRP